MEVQHYNIQANERLKNNDQLLHLIFLFFLSFFSFQCPRKCHKQVVRAIFYTDQTSGACDGVCACDRTYQMEKTAVAIEYPKLWTLWIHLGKPYLISFLFYGFSYLKSVKAAFSVKRNPYGDHEFNLSFKLSYSKRFSSSTTRTLYELSKSFQSLQQRH